MLNVEFAKDPASTRFFKMFNQDEISKFETTKFTLNLHERGVPVDFYTKFPKLNDFFDVIATTRASKEDFDIIAAVEAKDYPFYGL